MKRHAQRQRQRQPRTKTLEVGGLVAATTALQAAALAALGLYVFGSVVLFCAAAAGGYFLLWRAHDGDADARRARELARLERGLGGAHSSGGLALLARFMLQQLAAAGHRLAAFRRSVLGFSVTVSLADSAPLQPLESEQFQIAVVPAAAPMPPMLMAPAVGSALPSHAKLLPFAGGKEALAKKKPKKARRRNKPKDLVTFFTSNLARDTPIKTVQTVAMPPVVVKIPNLMALKPAPSMPVLPAMKELVRPSVALSVESVPRRMSEPAVPFERTFAKKVTAAPKPIAEVVVPVPQQVFPEPVKEVVVESKPEPMPAPVFTDADFPELSLTPQVSPVLAPEPVPEPMVEPLTEEDIPELSLKSLESPIFELPQERDEPEPIRLVTLYVKPSLDVAEVLPSAIVEKEPHVVEAVTADAEEADFLFDITVETPSVAPAEWARLKPESASMANPELRSMVEELDAMSREADAALVACSALLLKVLE